jgi:hypothetical protein
LLLVFSPPSQSLTLIHDNVCLQTLTSIYKIQENVDRNGAELLWAADLDSSFTKKDGTKDSIYMDAADLILGALQNQLERRMGVAFSKGAISIGASNLDLAVIGANGLVSLLCRNSSSSSSSSIIC